MTSKEVCEYLGITHNHLYQLVFREKLMWQQKQGKKIYFSRDDVEAYKNER